MEYLPFARLAYEPQVDLETSLNKNALWNRTITSILQVSGVEVHVSCALSTLNAKVGTIGTFLVNRVVSVVFVLVAAVRNQFRCTCRNCLWYSYLGYVWSWLLCKELAKDMFSDVLGNGGFHPGSERHLCSEVAVTTELDVERRKPETGTKRNTYP